MDQNQMFHHQPKRSFVVLVAWVLAAFCLGSLLTSVRMSQTVAEYLATIQAPAAIAHFNFLDNLAIYPLVALACLIGLTLLGFVGMLMHQVRTRINRAS